MRIRLTASAPVAWGFVPFWKVRSHSRLTAQVPKGFWVSPHAVSLLLALSQRRCEFLAAEDVLSHTLAWAKEHHSRVIPFESDEEEYFTVPSVTGAFTIYVYGQAGSQQCIWQQVIKTPTNNLRLSEPLVAY